MQVTKRVHVLQLNNAFKLRHKHAKVFNFDHFFSFFKITKRNHHLGILCTAQERSYNSFYFISPSDIYFSSHFLSILGFILNLLLEKDLYSSHAMACYHNINHSHRS